MNANEPNLRYQERSCPQCGYKVVNRFIKKCPRCLGLLPTDGLVSACGGCIQKCAPAAVSCTEVSLKGRATTGNAT
jgi:hypothetical protein